MAELFPRALGAWIFGSFADDSLRADSDLDIAVLPAFGDAIDAFDLDLVDQLSRRIHRDVDLVDLRAAPPVLQFEVFGHGHRIMAHDRLACDFFENTAISMYQRLNEERRELFEEIEKRGSVR